MYAQRNDSSVTQYRRREDLKITNALFQRLYCHLTNISIAPATLFPKQRFLFEYTYRRVNSNLTTSLDASQTAFVYQKTRTSSFVSVHWTEWIRINVHTLKVHESIVFKTNDSTRNGNGHFIDTFKFYSLGYGRLWIVIYTENGEYFRQRAFLRKLIEIIKTLNCTTLNRYYLFIRIV